MKQHFLVLFILAILVPVLGCGSGSSGPTDLAGYFGGNGQAPGDTQTGELQFNFTRAQSLELPTGSVRIRFDGGGGFSRTLDFAPTITLPGVPLNLRRLIITALDANGEPIANAITDVTVSSSQTTVIDLSEILAAPVSKSVQISPNFAQVEINKTAIFTASVDFSNGDVRPDTQIVYSVEGGIGSISPSGVFTASTIGNGTVTATFDGREMASATVRVIDKPVIPPTTTTGTTTGGTTGTTTGPLPDPPEPNGRTGSMTMRGEGDPEGSRDFIAQGRFWNYATGTNMDYFVAGIQTFEDAQGNKKVESVSLTFDGFNGDGSGSTFERWSASFGAIRGQELTVGSYAGATRTPFREDDEPGVSISGDGRGCNTSIGSFSISSIQTAEDEDGDLVLVNFSASWDHQCGSNLNVLGSTGSITYARDLNFVPPGN